MSSFVVIFIPTVNEAPPFAHADWRTMKGVDGNRIYDVKERGKLLEQI